MKKFLLNIFLAGSLFAGTYDYPYTALDKKDVNATHELDQFMYGDFSEIVRFNILDFSDGYFNDNAKQSFDDITETIKSYIENGREIKIKVIGHASRRTDDFNEVAVDSNTYANKIQNIFRFSQDLNETRENSKDFSENIAQSLVDNNISKDIIFVEHRGSEEMAYSAGTDYGRDLSNRVMVTMYVLDFIKKDTDKDGVYDSKDKCPKTPEGVKVDEVGCPLDTDKDGVYDYKDDCPGTPIGVAVDEHGCPFDTDGDGVLDSLDKCPGTEKGLTVDENGCPLTRILRLNYANDSAVIPSSDYHKVVEFAEFMKANMPYNARIIGHTDNRATAVYNEDLSYRRSSGVRNALVNEGVARERLEALGKGEVEPLETNETADGRAANRRIEVIILN